MCLYHGGCSTEWGPKSSEGKSDLSYFVDTRTLKFSLFSCRSHYRRNGLARPSRTTYDTIFVVKTLLELLAPFSRIKKRLQKPPKCHFWLPDWYLLPWRVYNSSLRAVRTPQSTRGIKLDLKVTGIGCSPAMEAMKTTEPPPRRRRWGTTDFVSKKAALTLTSKILSHWSSVH